MTSLEREAKENVYAVLDPHIQYEITINKHGEPPKHLSLSKPLTHQRTFDAHESEINNNEFENRFTTFKSGPTKLRRSNRSDQNANNKNYVCKTNNDIEYSKDPYFGIARDKQQNRKSKTYSRMYERNNSGKKDNGRDQIEADLKDARRMSNRSWNYGGEAKQVKEQEKERSFEELREDKNVKHDYGDVIEDYTPRPGKVREIASRFNRNSANVGQSVNSSKGRPKPLQSYGDQAYLDHVFPDAVEI